MGLFEINMPLLYGEGEKAFHRLQLELLRTSNDHSIFAWRLEPATDYIFSSRVLADSPAMFKNSGEIPTGDDDATLKTISSTMSMTNIGSSIPLPHYTCRDWSDKLLIAVLNCKDKEDRKLGIYLF
jgi:hypothetical protein